MPYKPADNYIAQFTTQRSDTGARADADATPIATATRNGSDDESFALTVTQMDTGRYKVTGTIPESYAAGDVVQISVAATVNEVAGVAVIDSFVIDAKRLVDLHDFNPAGEQVDVGAMAGSTSAAAALAANIAYLDAPVSSRSTFDPAGHAVLVGAFSQGVTIEGIWTDSERSQIRRRLALDGQQQTPSASGDLADILLILQAGART